MKNKNKNKKCPSPPRTLVKRIATFPLPFEERSERFHKTTHKVVKKRPEPKKKQSTFYNWRERERTFRRRGNSNPYRVREKERMRRWAGEGSTCPARMEVKEAEPGRSIVEMEESCDLRALRPLDSFCLAAFILPPPKFIISAYLDQGWTAGPQHFRSGSRILPRHASTMNWALTSQGQAKAIRNILKTNVREHMLLKYPHSKYFELTNTQLVFSTNR